MRKYTDSFWFIFSSMIAFALIVAYFLASFLSVLFPMPKILAYQIAKYVSIRSKLKI